MTALLVQQRISVCYQYFHQNLTVLLKNPSCSVSQAQHGLEHGGTKLQHGRVLPGATAAGRAEQHGAVLHRDRHSNSTDEGKE